MGGKSPIVIERMLPAPMEKVWKALTQPEQMKQWFFDGIHDMPGS